MRLKGQPVHDPQPHARREAPPGGELVSGLMQILADAKFALVSRVTQRLDKFGGETPPCSVVEN